MAVQPSRRSVRKISSAANVNVSMPAARTRLHHPGAEQICQVEHDELVQRQGRRHREDLAIIEFVAASVFGQSLQLGARLDRGDGWSWATAAVWR
jgi:hypothetical protein